MRLGGGEGEEGEREREEGKEEKTKSGEACQSGASVVVIIWELTCIKRFAFSSLFVANRSGCSSLTYQRTGIQGKLYSSMHQMP